MKNPIITVVVPVFNREKYIRKCLEIVTNQTYKNLEIIVVNDGSSDNSMKIVSEFPTVKVINHDVNKGLSAARNTGIANAKGKYIHFFDDDDEINTQFYESMLGPLEEENADVSCCSILNFNDLNLSQFLDKKKVHTTTYEKYEVTYVGKCGFVWRYLFKLDFLKKHNLLFEKGRFIEDLPFSFQAVYYANKIVSVPEAVYTYNYTHNSIINTVDVDKSKRVNDDYNHAFNFILDFSDKHNFKIPGVNTGRGRWFLRKIKMGLKMAVKYKTLKALKF